jgi:anti-sigma B factor antagonist
MSDGELDGMDGVPAVDASRPGELLRLRREPRESASGVIVHAAGEVDLTTAPQLAEELAVVVDQLSSPASVVLDLTAVTFLASAGLSVLLEHDQRCRAAGLELRIVAGNRTVARTLQMTGLGETLPVSGSLAEALDTTS